MRSRVTLIQMGLDTVIIYGVNITDADIIMSDGVSLVGGRSDANLVGDYPRQ